MCCSLFDEQNLFYNLVIKILFRIQINDWIIVLTGLRLNPPCLLSAHDVSIMIDSQFNILKCCELSKFGIQP